MSPQPSTTHGRRRRPGAFTLVEVLLALAVLGLAVVTVTQAVTAGHMQTHDALHRARAMMLAEAMVEEVLSKPYGDPDAGLGSSAEREDFGEIGDYHGFEEPSGTISDQAGATYPDVYQPFTRSVTVALDTRTIAPFGQRDGLLVTVHVTDQRSGAWTVRRFVAEPNP